MAATAEGAALTAEYVRSQLAVKARLVGDIATLWPLLDPAALDASFPRYFISAGAVVKDARHNMESLTTRYYRAFRDAEGVTSYVPSVDLSVLEPERLLASLLVTGPSWIKRAVGTGEDIRTAMQLGFVAQTGAAGRLALDAGRNTLDRQVRADAVALGWFRVTSGRACAFCAMIASRCAVYKSRASAGGSHRYHDHCACTVEPIFTRKSVATAQALAYREIWNSSTQGLSGAKAFNAFRKVIDSQ